MAHTQDNLVHGARIGTRHCSTPALLAALLTLAVALCNFVPAHADQTVPAPPTPILGQLTANGQLLLPVQLTGAKGQKVGANFILDTGVNECGITDAMADRLGLKPEAGIGDDGRPFVLNGAAARIASVPLLELGAIPCGPVPCIILGAKALAGPTGQAVDGILGNTLMDALPALINPQSRQVTFFQPGPITLDMLRSVGMADATAIPLDDHGGSDTYSCMVRIEGGGKSLQKTLVIDTGSAATMINGSDARKLGLSTQGEPSSEFMIFTGPAKMYVGAAMAIILGAGPTTAGALTWTGAMTTREVKVAYPKGDLPGFLPPHIGRDVLDHYLILMDYAEKKMYVKPLSVLNTPAFVPKITIGGK